VTEFKTVFDVSESCTQHDFALLVGVSDKTVSLLVKRGVIQSGDSVRNWLRAYCSHLREQAAGRATLGELDLATERAALAKAQRERVEMQNEITRREYAPIDELEQGLTDVLAMVGSRLDSVVGRLKKRSDALTADELDVVAGVLAEVRNEIADTRIDWFGETQESDD